MHAEHQTAAVAADALAAYQGLSKAETATLLAEGKGNIPLKKPTRSIGQIIFDNTFTYFNFINTVLGVVVLIISLHDPRYFRNMLFMGVVVVNTIGSALQEIKAKITIDKLSILTQPHADVTRDGERMQIPIEGIVPGDLLHLEAGQQLAVDGRMVSSDGLEMDESLLTGESDPMRKQLGDVVLSGSVAVAGAGALVVDKVSRETFAARITLEAQAEKSQNSALMNSLNKLLKYVSFVLFPLGVLLFGKIFLFTETAARSFQQVTTVGLLISMLPEGLILLTTIAMAASIVVLGKKMALVQTLPSIETLARVDVLCLDKTGTITSGEMQLFALVDVASEELQLVTDSESGEGLSFKTTFSRYASVPELSGELRAALSAYCAEVPSGNATQAALNAYCSGLSASSEPWVKTAYLPFSSQRKWSALSFSGHGTWYLGAAEKLFSGADLEALRPHTEAIALAGYRVLVLAHSPLPLSDEDVMERRVLSDLSALVLLVIADEIRADVAQTFDYFRKQNVEIKIISGDHPYTVEAIAKRAGISGFERIIDMSQVAEEADYSSICESYQLFGRVSPFQKRSLLKALKANGHVVAMTGDGVNDVLALKDADCGVAMASGSDAARAAADIVLLDNRMSVMVDAVYEGRRVINNIQRIAPMYLIKTTYASAFALMMLLLPIVFPILPIQGTLIGSLTVGIPSFFLALKANRERVSGSFLANVIPLALPPGIAAAFLLILVSFLRPVLSLTHAELSTVAMLVLILISLRALYSACLPFDPFKIVVFGLCIVAPFVVIALFPGIFMLAIPAVSQWWAIVGLLVFTAILTQALYALFRTSFVRRLIRHKFGKSRADLMSDSGVA